MTLSEQINALEKWGMKQWEIAEHCNTSQPTINRIKRGETTNPHWDVGKAIQALYEKKLVENAA